MKTTEVKRWIFLKKTFKLELQLPISDICQNMAAIHLFEGFLEFLNVLSPFVNLLWQILMWSHWYLIILL